MESFHGMIHPSRLRFQIRSFVVACSVRSIPHTSIVRSAVVSVSFCHAAIPLQSVHSNRFQVSVLSLATFPWRAAAHTPATERGPCVSGFLS